MKKIATVLCGSLLALTLNGCSSDSVNYDRYSLIEDIAPDVFDANYDITLSVNEALNEGGVVLKTSDVTLRSAVNHRWTSDIKEQLAMLLADSLSKYSVSNRLKIKVHVSKFYGSTSGQTYVNFNCIVSKGSSKPHFVKEYSLNGTQAKDGYASLVSKLKEDYVSLSDKFAQDLSLIE